MFTVGERIKFTHSIGRETQGSVLEDRVFGFGDFDFRGAFLKGFAKFAISRGTRKRELALFYKETNSANDYLDIHQQLKRLGFPVPITMRKIDDEYVVMTDYNIQGAVFWGKTMCLAMYDYFEAQIRRKYVDGVPSYALQGFADAYSKIETIKTMLKQYEHTANENNIKLPDDDGYEVVVYPNGEWRLMLIDLGRARLDYTDISIECRNSYCSNQTIKRIEYMYRWLHEQKKIPC